MASRFQKRREARRKREQQKIEEKAKTLGYVTKRGFNGTESVSVILPFSDTGCEYRRASFEFIKNKWKETYPEWEVVIGDCPTPEWRKGLAISDGLEKASGEIVIVADTDGWVDNVHELFEKLNDYVVVKPFEVTGRMTREVTDSIIKGKISLESVDVYVDGVCVSPPNGATRALGGMVISHREVLLKIPVDPRFYNWGWEDNAWTHSVTCLTGPIHYEPRVFKHLWHPPSPPEARHKENEALGKLYRSSNKEVSRLLKLIADGKKWRRENIRKTSTTFSSIPKIIHQIWVGDHTNKPYDVMSTWKIPGWEYRLWTEREINSLSLYNQELYDFYYRNKTYHGCSDVARAEILERFGGVYIDADTKRLEDIDELLVVEFFSVKSNMPGRIANGIIASIPSHPILTNYVERIRLSDKVTPPWSTIGGTLFTETIKDHIKHNGDFGVSILEPHTFYPYDSKGKKSLTNGKTYAEHFWGSTHKSYGTGELSSTTAIVIAGGEAKRWENHLGVPKHLIEIDGETILSRTARLLKENGVSSIYVATKEYDSRYDVPYATQVVVDIDYENNADVDKFLSSKHLWNEEGRTLVVYGDCYFTEEAIHTVINYPAREWTLFCRPNASSITGTRWGECFVQSFYPEHIEEHERSLHRVAELQKSGELKSGGGWHHYRVMEGLPPKKHAMRNRYVEIDDWTDDFDFPSDYEQWMKNRRTAGYTNSVGTHKKVTNKPNAAEKRRKAFKEKWNFTL